MVFHGFPEQVVPHRGFIRYPCRLGTRHCCPATLACPGYLWRKPESIFNLDEGGNEGSILRHKDYQGPRYLHLRRMPRADSHGSSVSILNGMNLNEFECILMHFISVSDCICILMYTYVLFYCLALLLLPLLDTACRNLTEIKWEVILTTFLYFSKKW